MTAGIKDAGRREGAMKGANSPSRVISRIASNLIMWAFSITCVYPVVWMIYSSLKTSKDFERNILGLPTAVHFDNYIKIFSAGTIGTYMFNTVRNTALSLIFIVLFGFINGYFISRFRFRGRKALYSLYMLGMLVPMHALLIPIYILFSNARLNNHWFTVMLPNVAFNLPMALFLVESFVGTIPRDIEEAASIDGASFSRTLFTIMLPLVTPILVTVGIITFFNCWNEFSFSLVLLNDQKLFTLPLGLTMFKGVYQSDYPKMMTTMVIAIAPAIILYFGFSKQIIQGMMSGALKG
jgi:raffinose/stachyose/melibiose transport system permease protein